MYTDKYIPEQEMIDDYQKHFYGFNPSLFPERFKFFQQLWNNFVVSKKNTLNYTPIDEWVFREDPKFIKPKQK